MKNILYAVVGVGFLAAMPGIALAGGGHKAAPKPAAQQPAAHHDDGHGGVGEPLFTTAAVPENEIEVEWEFAHHDSENENEFGLGAAFVIGERFQLGFEIPYVVRDPNQGKNEYNIEDIKLSGKYLAVKLPDDKLNLAFGVNWKIPTGDENKEIGQKGSIELYVAAGTAVPLGKGSSKLGAHFQFGVKKQIRTTEEEREEAEEVGFIAEEKEEIFYRLAFTTSLFDGRFSPTIEFLGTTVYDTTFSADEKTYLEIGGGFWFSPVTSGALAPLAIGLAAKGPVTNKQNANYTTKLVLKYEF